MMFAQQTEDLNGRGESGIGLILQLQGRISLSFLFFLLSASF